MIAGVENHFRSIITLALLLTMKHFQIVFFSVIHKPISSSLSLIIFSFLCGALSNQDVENDMPEPSDWDRFAAEEYETLVAEESAQAQFQEG